VTSLANAVGEDDEGGERIGPPPARRGVERDAEQDGCGERAVDEGDARLGGELRDTGP
jgi:hypothetical protein